LLSLNGVIWKWEERWSCVFVGLSDQTHGIADSSDRVCTRKLSTDVYPGGGINNALYGANAAYTASIPTGVVKSSTCTAGTGSTMKWIAARLPASTRLWTMPE
jgi:hypothetical protein